MKKCYLFLTIILLFGCCSLASCNSHSYTNDNEKTNEIILTKENFENYFTIEVDSDIDVTKHGDTIVLGHYIPPTYSAVADVDVDVFATVPLDSYNVSITLEVKTSFVYWNEKTITLNLSSSGSASESLTITTSDEERIFFENDCITKFYASIISVEGTIKTKQ